MMMTLDEQISVAAIELFGNDFVFRQWQHEAVQGIVQSTLSNTKHTLMEAPTGSGKSVTAIVAAYVLYKFYARTSYILVSDLSLFSQYEHDISRLKANCFGCIKGKENYICNNNGCPASQSECSLAGAPLSSLIANQDDRFDCTKSCKYIYDYRQAINSPITLMTYQLYFIQRNYVEDSLFGGVNKNFPARDLVICDECHNICNICQSHFSPIISLDRPKWMTTLDEYCKITPDEGIRQSIVNDVLKSTNSTELLAASCKYMEYISTYVSLNDTIRKKFAHGRAPKTKDKHALLAGNRARQEHCKFDDLTRFVDITGQIDYVVKSTSENAITLNFIFDDLMLKKYFHDKSNCELLMSATIGDFSKFAEFTGLDSSSTNVISIPSTFDFSSSPIYYSISNKMSYSEKRISLPRICKTIVEICSQNSNFRGIIQTGNYENAEYLKNTLPPEILSRCIFYRGSTEKTLALDQFLDLSLDKSSNKILVGPTLVEGLNFPDDVCRFQICMKIPYAHLGNEYIKKKKDLIDGWYEYDALLKICQGIGRGVRHEKDWCKTYILDGCVQYLLNSLKTFPTLASRFCLLAT